MFSSLANNRYFRHFLFSGTTDSSSRRTRFGVDQIFRAFPLPSPSSIDFLFPDSLLNRFSTFSAGVRSPQQPTHTHSLRNVVGRIHFIATLTAIWLLIVQTSPISTSASPSGLSSRRSINAVFLPVSQFQFNSRPKLFNTTHTQVPCSCLTLSPSLYPPFIVTVGIVRVRLSFHLSSFFSDCPDQDSKSAITVVRVCQVCGCPSSVRL